VSVVKYNYLMKLIYVSPHDSITSLFKTGANLGKLTVISGRNGSGKSQLLAAIKGGHVVTDIAPALSRAAPVMPASRSLTRLKALSLVTIRYSKSRSSSSSSGLRLAMSC
jgi:ABC-type lipoprotein export system ATPase subunit